MVYENDLRLLTTADSGGGIELSRAVAYIGRNNIAGMLITDLGGGLYCHRANFVPNEWVSFPLPTERMRPAGWNK